MTQAPVWTPGPAGVPVKSASISDVSTIADILADAFQDDRVFAWCIPDEGRRAATLPAFFDLFAGAVAQTGELHVANDGAALWVSPGQGAVPPEREEDFGTALEAVMGEDAERTFRIMNVLDENHPKEPHYYLPFLGVRRASQGQGLGSALLRAVLDRCDAKGLPAYLEATSEQNRRLYERHGFVAKGELTVDGCPPLYPMWREPR
ncbi:MAG: GNAT family N-acetyltransferase [Tepidiformaceae bacterium]